jgi:hypothetical protein
VKNYKINKAMKGQLVLGCMFLSVVGMAQTKAVEVAVTELSTEAITFTITVTVAGIVRWFEKRKLKKQIENEFKNGKIRK